MRLISEEPIADIGNISVGTFIDLRIPAPPTTECNTWFTVVLKKFQKINPDRAYKG